MLHRVSLLISVVVECEPLIWLGIWTSQMEKKEAIFLFLPQDFLLTKISNRTCEYSPSFSWHCVAQNQSHINAFNTDKDFNYLSEQRSFHSEWRTLLVYCKLIQALHLKSKTLKRKKRFITSQNTVIRFDFTVYPSALFYSSKPAHTQG